MESEVYLLLGTNQGDCIENLKKARYSISNSAGKITASSSVYKTAAWGKHDQPDFYNQILRIETPLNPHQLLTEVLSIEAKIGRQRDQKWGPRIIDIDILFYGNSILNEPALTIPHPGIPNRNFVLTPLNEIASDLIHPVLSKTIEQLLKECPDNLPVEKTDL